MNVVNMYWYRGTLKLAFQSNLNFYVVQLKYEGHTEIHEQLFFACKPGTADKGEYGGRWNQLLCILECLVTTIACIT